MNKNVIFSGIGMIFGIGIGHFVTKIVLEKRFNDEINREIEGVRQFYQQKQIEICDKCGITDLAHEAVREGKDAVKLAKTCMKTSESDPRNCPDNINILIENRPEPEKKEGESTQRTPKKGSNGTSEITEDEYFSKPNRGKKTAYNTYFTSSGATFETELASDVLDPGGPTEDDDEEEVEVDHEYDDTIEVEQMKRGIELISNIDYTERNGYDKEELFYYRKNGVLADSDDEAVEGFFDVVGSDFLDVMEQGGSKVIYVRNNNFAKDFLITVLNERFEGEMI